MEKLEQWTIKKGNKKIGVWICLRKGAKHLLLNRLG